MVKVATVRSAEMFLRKGMKELQKNSSALVQLFGHGLVVALPSLIYQLQFVTHFTGKLLPRLSCDCTTFLVASQKLQYCLQVEVFHAAFSDLNLYVCTNNQPNCFTKSCCFHRHFVHVTVT